MQYERCGLVDAVFEEFCCGADAVSEYWRRQVECVGQIGQCLMCIGHWLHSLLLHSIGSDEV